MAYKKQNFTDGQVLKAEHLNHIEEGINNATNTAEKSVSFEYQNLTETQKKQSRTNIGAIGQEDIDTATNTALAKAKESGEFNGADGKDGKDAVSPTVSVIEIGGGYRIVITDVDGTKILDVMDGKDGYTPVKGVDYFDGKDGTDGEDGYTPEKGKDYFTPAEKEEMVKDVIASLTTEIWKFTLADGTIVEKKVVLG